MVTQKLGLKEGNVTTEPIIYRKILESPSFLNSLADITILKKEKHIQHHGANIYKKILFNHGGENILERKI